MHAHQCLYCLYFLYYWTHVLNSSLLTLWFVVDIRATELHNESEEEEKGDKKLNMGTCEVSESENVLGKTSCVVCTRHDPHLSHTIVN